jgi:hypothetical protein
MPYLGVTLDTPLTLLPLIDQVRKKKLPKCRGVESSPEQEKWPLHQKWGPAVQVVHPFQDGLCVPHMELSNQNIPQINKDACC